MEEADYRKILQALPSLYATSDMAALPPAMLRLVSDLIPNVFATYNEASLLTGNVIAVYHPESWRQRHEAIMPRLVPNVGQHPIFQHVQQTGDGSAHFIADFLTEDLWLQTDFGRELATIGIAAGMIFCLQTSNRALIFVALNRRRHDFTERDREVANLLRPHLVAAYENAAALTEARAAALVSSGAIETSPYGVAVLDADGRLLHLNEPARELMARYFSNDRGWKEALPQPVHDWMEENAAGSLAPRVAFEQEAGARKIVIRRTRVADHRTILLLRETEAAPDPQRLRVLGLTVREAEVLHWMAEGKSNADIAAILQISSRTVEKHIEAIYAKLGVETRTAALLRAVAVT